MIDGTGAERGLHSRESGELRFESGHRQPASVTAWSSSSTGTGTETACGREARAPRDTLAKYGMHPEGGTSHKIGPLRCALAAGAKKANCMEIDPPLQSLHTPKRGAHSRTRVHVQFDKGRALDYTFYRLSHGHSVVAVAPVGKGGDLSASLIGYRDSGADSMLGSQEAKSACSSENLLRFHIRSNFMKDGHI